MSKRYYSVLFWYLASCVMALAHSALPAPDVAFPTAQPVQVAARLFVHDISVIDEYKESTAFEGTLILHWHDARLASPGQNTTQAVKTYSGAAAALKWSQIWHPRLRLAGQQGAKHISQTLLTISPTGAVTYEERFSAEVGQTMSFREFPFDTQQFEFVLQVIPQDAGRVRLTVFNKQHAIEAHPRPEEWQHQATEVGVGKYIDVLSGQSASQYVLSFEYKRASHYFQIQIIAPIFLLVLMAFSVFYMQHNPLVNRVGISLTAVLTIIVFSWRIFSTLPHIAYHSFLDLFLVYSFVISALTIVPSILYDHLPTPGHKQRLNRAVRWLFPLAYFLGIAIIFWLI